MLFLGLASKIKGKPREALMDKEKSETLKEISGDFIKSENKQK